MSTTYLRWQTVEFAKNLAVLIFTVALLFFLGDLTENLPAWLGETHSMFLKLTEFALDLIELYARLLGFLVALAGLWMWVRAGAAGQLTAVEAAGVDPRVHLVIPLFFAVLSVVGQVGFEYAGARIFADARTEIQRVRDGKQLENIGPQSLSVQEDTIRLYADDGILVAEVERQAGYHRVLQIREFDGHTIRVFDRANLEVTESMNAAEEKGEKPVFAVPDEFRFEYFLSFGRALTSFLLLILAFLLVRRHGRSSGLAGQTFVAIIVLSIVWVGYEVVAFVHQGWRIPQSVVPLYAVVIGTGLWFRNILRNRIKT